MNDQRPTQRHRIAFATMMGFRGRPFTKREFKDRFATDRRAANAADPDAWASVGLTELRDSGMVAFDGKAWRSTLPTN